MKFHQTTGTIRAFYSINYYRVYWKMAEQLKQQPAFVKINQLRPGAFGLNLTVKVVSWKAIMTRGRNGTQGRNMRLAECLVGDETGILVFTARNDQGMIYLRKIGF
ncbi:putative nucleic acid-binding protein [Helianthus anomalus]